MRNSTLFAALALISSLGWGAETVSLLDGAVQITLPASYSQLTPDEVAKQRRNAGNPPIAVFADKQGGGTIAITLSPTKEPFTDAKVKSFLKVAPKLYKRQYKGVVWHNDEVISSHDRKWGRMHYSVKGSRTQETYDSYITPFRKSMLGVNLSAAGKGWEASQSDLRAAFESMRIKE